MNLINHIKNLFAEPNPEFTREAFEAYLHRLPDHIQVAWFRDGDFIVGKVSDGHNEFLTQAKSGAEFIEMVNDTIYTVYDIPRGYLEVVKQFRAFKPPAEELSRLDDGSISRSELSLQKNPRLA